MSSFSQKEFKNNIVRGLIGIGLLIICAIFLYFNPGERISLLGGLETIGQRIHVWVVRLTGGDYRIIEQKITQQARLEDVMQKVTHARCENKEVLYQQLTTLYSEIEAMDRKTYRDKLSSVINAEQYLYQLFQQTCE